MHPLRSPASSPALKVVRTVAALRKTLSFCSRPLVLVPTMGALHEGHAALIRRARTTAGVHGTVGVSIFVNPPQFAPGEDLSGYPRTLSQDVKLCASCQADLIFAPNADELYRPGHSTWIEEGALGKGFCGSSRPGHFRGVCTVVAKLFNLVQPDVAVFGEKDFQQLAVIRRMVRDLDFPVKIMAVATVREKDGLAFSSRNRYLNPVERAAAPALRRSLQRAAAAFKTGASAEAVRRSFHKDLHRLGGGLFQVDYFELADPHTLVPFPANARTQRPAIILAAAFLGATRLIDNILVR